MARKRTRTRKSSPTSSPQPKNQLNAEQNEALVDKRHLETNTGRDESPHENVNHTHSKENKDRDPVNNELVHNDDDDDDDDDDDNENVEDDDDADNDGFKELDIDSDEDEESMMETLALADIPKETVVEARNNEPALERKLAEISIFTAIGKQPASLPFRESLCVSLSMTKALSDRLAVGDLEREKQIAASTTGAVHKGLDRLREEKVKFRRPGDYFAQMVKTDEQMGRIKKRMLKQKENIEAAQTRRNNRDIQKNRKKVRQEQMEKEQEKKRKANEEIENVRRLRQERLQKRSLDDGNVNGDDGDNDDEDEEDEFPIDMLDVEQLDEDSRFQKHGDIVTGKKKAWKPSAGGIRDSVKKGREGRSGRALKPDGAIAKKGKGGKKKRLGKSRRQAIKNKK